MNNNILAEEIYNAALDSGFDDCGIIAISEMSGYKDKLSERMNKVPESRKFYERIAGIAEIQKRFTWAKSLVVCTTWFGKFRYPKSLRGMYAKSYFLSVESDRNCAAYQQKQKFTEWFRDKEIKCEGGLTLGHGQVGGLRYAACKAGLGIIRKNNFLYNEKGSWIELDGYVIDKEYELKHEKNIKPCPEHCNLCQKSCPTGSLSAPFTMNPLRCVSYCTTFGRGKIPDGLSESNFKQWLVGCDSCQDCCPFNRHDWDKGENFPGLDELVNLLKPENILRAPDEELQKKVCPKTVEHIMPDDVQTLRINAERVQRFIADYSQQ